MYQYDQLDQQFIQQRSIEFRRQVARRLAGQLSEEAFKPLRLMNGLYLQLHAYMLRVAIPYGTLSATQMRALGNIAARYDRGYGHFTTRQNIQFNWVSLVDTPDILDELAKVQMHAIQTSGNCIRNITSDPLAGVAADESIDPRPLCELLRQWSSAHPEFLYLPRKFKFAITGAKNDRALIKAHDIGLRVHKDQDALPLCDIYVGGGQGRTPRVAQLLVQNISLSQLLPWLEAIMRVYNQYGRRDNKYKARIKILLGDLGIAEFKYRVEEVLKNSADNIDAEQTIATYHDIASRFSHPFAIPDEHPTNRNITPTSANAENNASQNNDAQTGGDGGDGAFSDWLTRNVKTHKHPELAIVYLSLKPIGGVPGDLSAVQMQAIADLSEQYSEAEIRVTHRQNLVLPHIHRAVLPQLWQALVKLQLAHSNIDQPSDIIACPGMDYCSLATARSIPLAQKISNRISAREKTHDLTGININISGCINACAHHHVASIGILGLDRKGTENYQLTLGGRADDSIQLGERLGPGLSQQDVPHAIERLIDVYVDQRNDDETFDQTYQRLDKELFKAAVYDK